MKDGGNAFPAVYHEDTWRTISGMSLRDYFAAAALQGMLVEAKAPSEAGVPAFMQTAAGFAYQMADAMLLERQKLQGKTE